LEDELGRITFDLDAMRSFKLGVELGSFARAADHVSRSTSAVSAQLKKLEHQAGTPLVRKSGRGLELTNAGEIMLSYAKRMIELNDEAVIAVQEKELEGWVRLGLQEDFGEGFLSEVLMNFSRANPKVKIEARVARNHELIDRVKSGALDLALTWGDGAESSNGCQLASIPLHWIVPRSKFSMELNEPDVQVPLVAFEAPCFFRSCAVNALDRAELKWRNSFTSPNLSGLWAAVSAELGITIRTGIGLPEKLRPLADGEWGLPSLPSVSIAIHQHKDTLNAPSQRLANIVAAEVKEAVSHLASDFAS
jgi:DNA-binding transcriptional LysR family regulator